MPGRPTFFIAAAPRSGTTSLYSYLGQHPDIAMSAQKEPAYYHFRSLQPNFDELAELYGSDRKSESLRRYKRSLSQAVIDPDAYSGLWDHHPDAADRGDASPTYLYHFDALRLIREEIPQAKFVLLLRNPVDRAYSQYLQYLRHGIETDYDFETAIAQEPTDVNNYWWGERRYLRLGQYAEHVEDCIRLFGEDNLLIILREEFESQPGESVDQVLSFLGRAPFDGFDDSIRHNRAFVPQPSLSVRAARTRGPAKRLGRLLVPASVRTRLFHRIMTRRVMTPPPLLASTRARLNSFFHSDVRRLEQLINRDLAIWTEKN